jgi:predicted dehydrogenase
VSSTRFRLALVGCGLIGANAHLPAALSCPEIDVVALVDPVQERAASVARTYGMSARIATRIDEIAGAVDGAIIATPNHTHRSLALECIAAGIAVLIEKPLATTVAEGQAIVEAAERAGVTLAVGYCQRFRGDVELLKELLDDGYFGRAVRFVHQVGSFGGWAPLSGYNLDRKTAGGGVLVVTATHFLDRMLFFFGFPDHAELCDDGFDGPEANCTAYFRYHARDLAGVARYSKTAGLPNGMVVETERGYVRVADADGALVRFTEHARPRIEQIVQKRNAPMVDEDLFRLQLRDFVAACRERRTPRVDGRQGLQSLQLVEALYTHRRPLDEAWYRT